MTHPMSCCSGEIHTCSFPAIEVSVVGFVSVVPWHEGVIGSRTASGCKWYHAHSGADGISLVAGVSPGWNVKR